MKTKFTVGQEVFCILHGKGLVTDTQGSVVFVTFSGRNAEYSSSGKSLNVEAEMPLLYPCRPKIISLPQDTKVWVWNKNENPDERKVGAYFSHFSEEGKPVVFGGGQTSWTHDSTAEYDYYEVVQ